MKKLDIVYEDKDILVVNKKSGLLTVNDKKNNNNLYEEVYDYLHKKNQKVFIVHRLDKDTSGLILFAKNVKIKNYFQENWDKVIRKYKAIVEGNLNNDGIIKSYLYETKSFQVLSSNNHNRGKLAITKYKVIKNKSNLCLIDIDIKTGRKNQIRCQLDSINHPIVGDKKYHSNLNLYHRLALHAYYLKFYHPRINQVIEIEIKCPKFMELF